jgi:hypothetical protein
MFSVMYSLPLLGATTLVLLGGRVIIQVARAWLIKNHLAFDVPRASRAAGSRKTA